MTPAPDPDADLPALRDTVAHLRRVNQELLGTVAELRATVEKQQAHIERLVRMTFGRRSERVTGPTLFADIPAPDPPPPVPEPPGTLDPPPDATPVKRRGHGRRPRPADLPRERVEIDLTEAEKACPCCQATRVRIGTSVSERLDYRPASLFVRQIVRASYAYLPRSRTFIPARLEDNPDLMRTGYAATLEAMPEPLRSMLRHGDMLASRIDDRWQLIPTRWVVLANRRWAERGKEPLPAMTRLGVDVAMEGKDWTILAPLHGSVVASLVKRKGKDTPDGQSVVALILAAWDGRCDVNVDAIGIGKSVCDVAKVTGLRQVKAVVVSRSTSWRDPKIPQLAFTNTRSAMMWNVRERLNPEGPPETRLALPPDPELLADLTAPRWGQQVGGIAVESKEDIRARIGRSTDAGDAVALACWDTGGGWDLRALAG